MAYDVNQKKSYNQPAAKISQLAAESIARLGGKAGKKSNPAAGQLTADFNKQVKSQVMPNRIQILVKIAPQSPQSCDILAHTYPIDPVGNKLMFGVRGNAAGLVMDTFFAELEARLGA